jgi:hypothetical protein
MAKGKVCMVCLVNVSHSYSSFLFLFLIGVFGVPLVISISYARGTIGYQDADQVNHQRAAAIPLVVSKCGSYLKRNGKVSLKVIQRHKKKRTKPNDL